MNAPAHRWVLAWALAAATAFAQAPPAGQPPPDKPGTTHAGLPDLGPPAPLPEGAPPHLAKIDREGLRTHAYWLADDAREGRRTSSKGQLATVKYVSEHFQRLGLKPLGDKKTFVQSYPLTRASLDAATSFTFGDWKLDRDHAVLAKGATKVQLAGRFVDCGNGGGDAVQDGLAGKIPVVVLRGGRGGVAGDLQAVQRYTDVAQRLAKAGATAGVVCLAGEQGSLANALNYRALMPDHPLLQYGGQQGGLDVAIPLLVLPAPAAEKLIAFIAGDKAAGKLSIVVKEDDKASGSNVVALLEGTSKKSEAIVFSAHHDHVGRRLDGDVFNGADDNASGTSGLLELAEAFAQGGPRPERSIVFLSVSGEELGLWGSDWFAAHPTWPLDKIVADVNIDMIGRAVGETGGPTKMLVTPSHDHDKYSTLVRDGVSLGKLFQIEFGSGDIYYQRSDHYNFAKNGVPVVFFCDGEHPDYHQVTDTADRLDYARMEAIARLAAWTGWQAANAKSRPQELGKQPNW